MEEKAQTFLTTPLAILLGSLVIAVSILIHGGVIKIGSMKAGGVPTAPAPAQPSAPLAKSEAEIVNGLKEQAKTLGLDANKFDSCLESGDKASLVSKDLSDGSKAGVNGTPAFFVNGRLISGAVPFEQFKTIIDEELSGNAPANTKRETVDVGDLPVLGQESAKVTLVEFSDYQCPFCGRFYSQTEGQIKKEYTDKGLVKFYYRDFPLSQIHPGAQKAAEAARCAGDQNKYWEYHDLVFQNQNDIF